MLVSVCAKLVIDIINLDESCYPTVADCLIASGLEPSRPVPPISFIAVHFGASSGHMFILVLSMAMTFFSCILSFMQRSRGENFKINTMSF